MNGFEDMKIPYLHIFKIEDTEDLRGMGSRIDPQLVQSNPTGNLAGAMRHNSVRGALRLALVRVHTGCAAPYDVEDAVACMS